MMMSPPTSLKREFFKKLVIGLRICNKNNDDMSILDRKNAIKLSADVAIASARNCSTSWSRALICKASNGSGIIGRRLVQQMLGRKRPGRRSSNNKPMIMAGAGITPPRKSSSNNNNVSIRWRLSSSSSSSKRRARRSGCARSVVNSLVRKRSEVLKRLVPGGRCMDGIGLIEETLDYMVALRTQVDVMRSLVAVPHILNLHGS